MGFADEEPLWGPTVSQDFPEEFQGSPFDQQAPAKLNQPMQGPAQAPAPPANDGLDWNKIIQGIAAAGLSGMQAGRGDIAGSMRTAQMPALMEQQKKQQQMEQDKAELDEIKTTFDIMKNFDTKEGANEFLRAQVKGNPRMQARFGELMKTEGVNIKVGDDKGTIVWEKKFPAGAITMPDGTPNEEGDYKVTWKAGDLAKWKPGSPLPMPKSLERSKGAGGDLSTMSEVNAAAVIEESKGPDGKLDKSRLFENIRKLQGGKSPESQIFNAMLDANGGDFNKATEDYAERIYGIARRRGGGAAQGALDVASSPTALQNKYNQGAMSGAGTAQGTLNVQSGQPFLQNVTEKEIRKNEGEPLEPAVQEKITALETLKRQSNTINSNLKDEFLGPIRGTQAHFGMRRSLGSKVNDPVGDKEIVFRQSLEDVDDQLLRARSGAAINEQEDKRLRNILPKATDEPKVFRAGLKRFQTELDAMIKDKKKMATTPRGQVGSPGSGPRGLPKVLSIERLD